jgi:hypothetical protein
MSDADPTLGQLLDRAVTEAWAAWPPSRLRQLKSHVARYADWLGAPLKECPPRAYHLPEDRRRALIDRAAAHCSDSYRRNIRRDLAALLTLAVDRGWLPPLAPPLADWRTKGEARAFEDAYYGRLGGADRSFYALTKCGRPRRHRGQPPGPAHPTLTDVAPALGKDLEDYFRSCTDPFDARTPQKIKKVDISVRGDRERIDALAGYAVYECGLPAELLTLRDVCDAGV